MRTVGIRIKGGALRHELDIRGLSPQEFALLAGIAPATVAQAIRRGTVSARTLRKIAEGLGATPPSSDLAALVAS